MTWSKEKPQADGSYWFRSEDMKQPKLLQVKNGVVKAGLWIFEIRDLYDGEFQGPVQF